MIIHGDFYRAVKAPPLSSYQFLQMPGADSPNGGLWYIHNAHPRGPVVRMLEEAVAIGLKVLKLRKRIDFRQTPDKQEVAYLCSWTDQDVLECAPRLLCEAAAFCMAALRDAVRKGWS